MVIKLKIEHFMSRNLVVSDINSTIYDIALKMKQNDIGFIPINEGSKIVGVITDRDIVVKAIANKDTKIKDYINKDLIKININKDAVDAIELMGKKKVKRLLVEDNNKLVGIISLSDIINNVDSISLYDNVKKIYAIYRNTDEYLTKINEFEM